MFFWETVEYVREFKEISRKELAYKANFSINSISTGISRKSIPAADVACRIAHVLGVSVEFLVNGIPKNVHSKNKKNKLETEIVENTNSLEQKFLKYEDFLNELSKLPISVQKNIFSLVHTLSVQ